MRKNGMDANRRLAELLGWTDIFDVGSALLGSPPTGAPASRGQARVPDWTGDWRDCGPLMVEHLHSISIAGVHITARANRGFGMMRKRGPSESASGMTRRAIVDAVIAKLQEVR